jgi:hypothetical protein
MHSLDLEPHFVIYIHQCYRKCSICRALEYHALGAYPSFSPDTSIPESTFAGVLTTATAVTASLIPLLPLVFASSFPHIPPANYSITMHTTINVPPTTRLSVSLYDTHNSAAVIQPSSKLSSNPFRRLRSKRPQSAPDEVWSTGQDGSMAMARV